MQQNSINVENQLMTEIAPGVKCYHQGAILFAGGKEAMEQAELFIKEWNLSEDEAEIQEDIHANIFIVLLKDIVR